MGQGSSDCYLWFFFSKVGMNVGKKSLSNLHISPHKMPSGNLRTNASISTVSVGKFPNKQSYGVNFTWCVALISILNACKSLGWIAFDSYIGKFWFYVFMSCLIKKNHLSVPNPASVRCLHRRPDFHMGFRKGLFIGSKIFMLGERQRCFCSCFLQSTQLLLTHECIIIYHAHSLFRGKALTKMSRLENILVVCMLQFELCGDANFISNQKSPCSIWGSVAEGLPSRTTWEQGLKWEVSEKDVHWLRTSVHTTSTCAS